MKKLLCTLLALTLVFALFAGCAEKPAEPGESAAPSESVQPSESSAPSESPTEPSEETADGQAHVGKRVLAVQMSLADTNLIFLNDVLEEKFTEAGFEYTAVSGEFDPLKQIEQIENGIVQGYDMILIVPVTGEAVADACQAAMDEGIFVYNFINDSVNHDVYRTVDAAYSGEMLVRYGVEEWALKHFANAAPGSINTVIIGNDSDSHTKARFDSACAIVEEYPELNVIDIRAVEASTSAGQSTAENILTMNPDVKINLWLILDATQASGVNAVLMAENSGIQEYIEDVCLVSNSLTEESAGLLRASVNNESVYRLCAATGGDTYKNVQEIVDQCIAHFNGDEVEPFSPVNIDLITPDNVSDFGF